MSNDIQSSTSQSDWEHRLKVDFSHQISYGNSLEEEFICTLQVIQAELTGVSGALNHLSQTVEANKLCSVIATGFAKELECFDSLLAGDLEDLPVEKLRESLSELIKLYFVLDDCVTESGNNQFSRSLVLIICRKIDDIEAILDTYCEQREKVEVPEQAEEQAISSMAEGCVE